MRKSYFFTSESVTEGHPDKICDQVSDAILDEYLKIDKNVRVACDCLTTTNKIIVAGEVRTMNNKTLSKSHIEKTVRNVIKDIGYEQEEYHWKHLDVDILLHKQSADIAVGVDSDKSKKKEEGAGDQGLMFGKQSDLMLSKLFQKDGCVKKRIFL